MVLKLVTASILFCENDIVINSHPLVYGNEDNRSKTLTVNHLKSLLHYLYF